MNKLFRRWNSSQKKTLAFGDENGSQKNALIRQGTHPPPPFPPLSAPGAVPACITTRTERVKWSYTKLHMHVPHNCLLQLSKRIMSRSAPSLGLQKAGSRCLWSSRPKFSLDDGPCAMAMVLLFEICNTDTRFRPGEYKNVLQATYKHYTVIIMFQTNG
jgi:hypothetical protein